jgi:hypothetical protein
MTCVALYAYLGSARSDHLTNEQYFALVRLYNAFC